MSARTGRWWLLWGLAFGLTAMGLALRRGDIMALVLPLWLWTLAGASPLPALTLEARRALSRAQAQGGEPVTVTVEVENKSVRPIVAELYDRPPAGLQVVEGSTALQVALAPGERACLEYTVTAHRGLFQFESILTRAGDPWGFRILEQALSCPARLAVLPAVEDLEAADLEIRPRRTRVYAGIIPARAGGTGIEYFGSRPYRPGDELRRLNWKATARRDEPVTDEFEQERAADVAIILDARRVADVCAGGEKLFEHSARAAASLARYFLRQGNRVGLLRYGEHLDWTFPGFGRRQEEKILEALTRARQGDSLVFQELERLPVWLFPAGSQIVLISPVRRKDVPVIRYLRARDWRVLVVSPDPIAFELHRWGNRAPAGQRGTWETAVRLARLERSALLDKLRRVGVRVVDWDVRGSLTQALRCARRPVPPMGGELLR
jgi:uncharacterized protein (DUF58 family)